MAGVTNELFRSALDASWENQNTNWRETFCSWKFSEARDLFDKITTDDEFAEFLTLPGYADSIKDEDAGIGQIRAGKARTQLLASRRQTTARQRCRRTHLARRGAETLWSLLHTEDFVPTLGALTGNQAVQQVKAGLKAIYLSGWQVAADANLADLYPDQSLPNSVPAVVKRINQAFCNVPINFSRRG
jgi:hypothetical protein